MNDVDRLRDAWLAGGSAAEAADCPDSGILWQAVCDELDRAATARVIDHVAVCRECAHGWQLAQEVAVGSALPETRPAEGSQVRSRWLLGGLAAAAAVILMFVIRPDAERTPPTFREPETGAIRSLVPEEMSLPRDHCLLQWSPGAEGSHWRIRVATAELGVIVSNGDLTQPEFLVPAEALSGVPSGGYLLWRLTEILTDGTERSSITFRSRLE